MYIFIYFFKVLLLIIYGVLESLIDCKIKLMSQWEEQVWCDCFIIYDIYVS